MYQNIFIEKTEKFNNYNVHLWDDKLGYQKIKFNNYAYKKNDNGQYNTIFGDKVSKVFYWSKRDVENGDIFESDVSNETRFLVDNYDSEESSEGHSLLIFDIEVEVTDGFPDVNEVNNIITSISTYDKNLNEYYVFILDSENEIQHTRNGNEEIIPFRSEEDLLVSFVNYWRDVNPTLVTGWSIDGFDIPYLYNRLSKVFGENYAKKLSPINLVYYNQRTEKYYIAGVSSMDYLSLYRKFSFGEKPSYTLNYISNLELGEGKVEYDGSLDNLRKNDINKFIDYNLVDTKLVKKIDDKMNYIDLARSICHKGRVSYESIYYDSRWIEGAILINMKKDKLVAPNKPNVKMTEKRDKFAGAYVKDPIVGKYEWIYDLDFTSLYPSIVMSLNISPETKVGKINEWDGEKFVSDKNREYSGRIYSENGLINGNQLNSVLKAHNIAISANGVMYKKDIGIIPKILMEWFSDKDEYDKLMKKYGKEKNKEKTSYYKNRRTVAKVMLNSVYGVLGLPVFRFYDIDNAEAVTTTGVQLIKYSEKMANYYYNNIIQDNKNTDYCIYIDTDSLFLSTVPLIKKLHPNVDLNDENQMIKYVMEITNNVQQFLNSSFDLYCDKFLNIQKHRLNIKQEIIGRSAIWLSKKRYATWIINDNGVEKNEIEYKGLDVVRSDFPIAFKKYLEKLLTSVLYSKNKEEINNDFLQFRNNIKNVLLEEIAIPTSVKDFKKYETNLNDGSIKIKTWESGAPVHVKGVINYNNLIEQFKLSSKFEKIKNAEKVKWFYVKQNPYGIDSIAIRGYDDPKEIIEFIKKYIDFEKIYSSQLEKKIESVYNSLDWEVPSQETKIIDEFFDF